jgi:thiamine monophosphate synthase
VHAVRQAGAERVAVVRALTEASDAAGAARVLRAALTAPAAAFAPVAEASLGATQP